MPTQVTLTLVGHDIQEITDFLQKNEPRLWYVSAKRGINHKVFNIEKITIHKEKKTKGDK